MTTDAFNAFVQLMEKNLSKNGFPGNKVAFPLERMYEEADKRGFSFNKVRDVLRERGIASELTDDDKVVFSAIEPEVEEPSGEDQNLFDMAQQMLSRMSPQEREEVMKMVQNMTPETMEAMKRQWESMPESEKRRAMEEMERRNQG